MCDFLAGLLRPVAVNTLFEIAQPPEDIANEIAQYRDLWQATFQLALETENIADSETRAKFLVGALWGALSQIRLAGNTTAAKPMTSVVVETVRSWNQVN